MALVSFPTSKDVYIEVDGKRLAAAQSYKAKTSRESRFVEVFRFRMLQATTPKRLQLP